jgi:radical SAM superfamily enzyme YgiQ (UPF0313 family)
MGIALISAPTVTDFGSLEEIHNIQVRASASEPPLGILTLAAVLEETQWAPFIIDLNQTFFDFADAPQSVRRQAEFVDFAASTIARNAADVYGFSTICSSYPLTIRIAGALKAIRPSSVIVFGGPQASVVAAETLRHFPDIDYIIRGEADDSLRMFLHELGCSGNFIQVPGLTYRDGSEVRQNANSPVVKDLDAIPFPAYHLTTYLVGASSASLELGRGCPYACTFCSTNDFFRRRFRLRSPNRVLCDMRRIHTQYKISRFTLVHDMFTADRKRVVEFCDVMENSSDGFTWSCSARTDSVDDGLLNQMWRAGCRGIFYGVETGSQRIQKIINKNLDIDRAKQVITSTERQGIDSIVSLISGFPEETWEDLRETLSVFMYSARHPHSEPQLNILAPLAGTPIHEVHKEQMTLEGLCSDMSHQGKSQDPKNNDLIRAHPKIFPNFYSLPLRNLDRDALFELHEFLMITAKRFKWLLVAINEAYAHILDFFLEWRHDRSSRFPLTEWSAIRHYYRTPAFRSDLLIFIRNSPACSVDSIDALVTFHEKVGVLSSLRQPDDRDYESVQGTVHLAWNEIPFSKYHSPVLELDFDIQEIIEDLKAGVQRAVRRSPHFYVLLNSQDGELSVNRVSDWIGILLRECDGRKNLVEVLKEWSEQVTDVEDENKEYAFVRLLETVSERNLLALRRPRL